VTIRLKSVKNSPQTRFPSLRSLFSDKLLVILTFTGDTNKMAAVVF